MSWWTCDSSAPILDRTSWKAGLPLSIASKADSSSDGVDEGRVEAFAADVVPAGPPRSFALCPRWVDSLERKPEDDMVLRPEVSPEEDGALDEEW